MWASKGSRQKRIRRENDLFCVVTVVTVVSEAIVLLVVPDVDLFRSRKLFRGK